MEEVFNITREGSVDAVADGFLDGGGFHCLQVEGAKMIMSRCRRSHQKGAVSLMLLQLVVDTTIAWMMAAWRL